MHLHLQKWQHCCHLVHHSFALNLSRTAAKRSQMCSPAATAEHAEAGTAGLAASGDESLF